MAIFPSRRAFISGAATSLLAPSVSARGPSSKSMSEGPAFLQSGTGAVSRTAQSKLGDIVSVKDFGALGDGTTDDTAAFQAAIDVVTSHGNTMTSIFIPPGTYKITDQISINKNYVTLYGAGDKSELYFVPATTGKIMLKVQHSDPAQVIKYITLRDFSFRAASPAASIAKTGIKIIDGTGVTIRNVNVTDYSWTSTARTSIALHMAGRDTHNIIDCYLVADKPLVASTNLNSATWQFDYHNFIGNIFQTLDPSGYGITFEAGVNPTSWTMIGCAAVSGNGGIYLNNQGTVVTGTPSLIRIVNFRCEGGAANGVGVGGGYGIYMDFGTGNPACGNITIEECSVNDPTCNGYFFKNLSCLMVDNVNCGFAAANRAFILTDVSNAYIRSLGIGHNSAIVQFNNMFAQHVVKLAIAYANPANPSVAFGVYTHYDADTPGRNLVYRNGVRSWQRTQALDNREEMALPALAAGGSMLVFVSCGLGGAVYSVIYNNSFLLNATPGWDAAIGLVSDGAGNTNLVNRSAGRQIFTVNTNGT